MKSESIEIFIYTRALIGHRHSGDEQRESPALWVASKGLDGEVITISRKLESFYQVNWECNLVHVPDRFGCGSQHALQEENMEVARNRLILKCASGHEATGHSSRVAQT